MAARELTFHSDFQRVTIMCNGVPLSLNGEVDLTIKRPTKLDEQSRKAWSQLDKESAAHATVEATPIGD